MSLSMTKATKLGDAPSLDGVTNPGLYFYTARSETNPGHLYTTSSVEYFLVVWKHLDGDVMQTRIVAADGSSDTRVRTSGSWGSWKTYLKGTALFISGTLPTSDPAVAGQVYAATGALKVSAG